MRNFGINANLLSTLQDMLEEPTNTQNNNHPSTTYIRDTKAMAATPADVKEYPTSYVFVIDMPGIPAGETKVQLEDDDMVLVVSGERKQEKEEGVKFLRMERRVGKFMRRFLLPENANKDGVSAVCRDGVLIVTVEKLQPKKPRTIEVVKIDN